KSLLKDLCSRGSTGHLSRLSGPLTESIGHSVQTLASPGLALRPTTAKLSHLPVQVSLGP
ncbi:MAG: hypothetical protein NTV92_03925, partial [Candidatus Bipolaricaulota bacterium]|nr:hypothetical protein [Candidatus Bipolaricaulota bacterium]